MRLRGSEEVSFCLLLFCGSDSKCMCELSEKIQWVVTEREALLKYKGQATPGATSQSSATQVVGTMDENDKVSAMLDLVRKTRIGDEPSKLIHFISL